MVLITPRSVSSVGRLDALAVDTNFAKKAEGWVSSCGDVTFWLELMAPKRQGREFDPHTDYFFLFFTSHLFFCFLQKRSRQREEVEEVDLLLVKESTLKLSDVYLPKKRACTVYLF